MPHDRFSAHLRCGVEKRRAAHAERDPMDLLDGRSILVADDEPIIGLDIAEALRGEGATVVSAHNVKTAITLAATADLSAAVLDINLAGEDCSLICPKLADRRIPFLFHSATPTCPSSTSGLMLRS